MLLLASQACSGEPPSSACEPPGRCRHLCCSSGLGSCPFCCCVSHCAVETWDAGRPRWRIFLPMQCCGAVRPVAAPASRPLFDCNELPADSTTPSSVARVGPRSCCAHAPALQAQVGSTIGSPQSECREELSTQCVELNRQLTGLRSCLEAVQDVVGVDGTTLWQNSFQRVMRVRNMYWSLDLARAGGAVPNMQDLQLWEAAAWDDATCPCMLTISCSTVCLPRCVRAQSTMFSP